MPSIWVIIISAVVVLFLYLRRRWRETEKENADD